MSLSSPIFKHIESERIYRYERSQTVQGWTPQKCMRSKINLCHLFAEDSLFCYFICSLTTYSTTLMSFIHLPFIHLFSLPFIYLPLYLFIHSPVHIFIHQVHTFWSLTSAGCLSCIYPFINLLTHLLFHLSIYPSIHPLLEQTPT